MLVSVLPINIPFYELAILCDGFDPNTISSIKISGIDNQVHPEFNREDPTYSYQVLGCAGINLVDQVNNATLYYEANPEGDLVTYDFKGKIDCSAGNKPWP